MFPNTCCVKLHETYQRTFPPAWYNLSSGLHRRHDPPIMIYFLETVMPYILQPGRTYEKNKIFHIKFCIQEYLSCFVTLRISWFGIHSWCLLVLEQCIEQCVIPNFIIYPVFILKLYILYSRKKNLCIVDHQISARV